MARRPGSMDISDTRKAELRSALATARNIGVPWKLLVALTGLSRATIARLHDEAYCRRLKPSEIAARIGEE